MNNSDIYIGVNASIATSANITYNDSDTVFTCSTRYTETLSTVYFQSLVYVMYSVIFIFSLLGNGLVCYVVYSSPRMKTVTNIFIVNLAVGDILMTVLCVPFSFVSVLILGFWPFGGIMCRAVSFSQAVSVFVSAYTLVAISFDRYIAIMWPLKPRMSKRQAKLIILIVWLVASVTAMPIMMVSELEQPVEDPWYRSCDKVICRESWSTDEYRSTYSVLLMVLQYGVPLLVLVITYTSIAIVVWGKQTPGEAENSRDQRMARSKRKMIKMMVIVVVVFTVCWLPYNILLILIDHIDDIATWFLLPYMFFSFHWLAMSHTCYNSVIYCWMNARFRAGFSAVLHIFPKKYHQATSSGANNHSMLHRFNTSTTYVSTRRDTPSSLKSSGMDRHIMKNKFPILDDEDQM